MFRGKVCVVTGAGSGIGKGIAIAFAAQGAQVAICARRSERIEETAKEITNLGAVCLALPTDVRSDEAVKKLMDQTAATFGRIDIVVANAGVGGIIAPIDQIEPQEWDDTIAIDLRGIYLTAKYAVPHLKANPDGGSIIIMSSINGTRIFRNPGLTAYTVAKAGQVALAKTLAVELAKHNIRVNAVCPGFIESRLHTENRIERNVKEAAFPMDFPDGWFPLKSMAETKGGKPQHIADAVLFLASDKGSLITGSELWVDGAESLVAI